MFEAFSTLDAYPASGSQNCRRRKVKDATQMVFLDQSKLQRHAVLGLATAGGGGGGDGDDDGVCNQ